jgi:hypothetical protein
METNKQHEQWKQRIHDYQESGLTMKAWCNSKNISFHQMKYWIRNLSLSKRKRNKTSSWVTVSSVPDPSPEGPTLTVHVGGATIEIRTGFDPSLLGQVVRALEAHS